MSCMKLGCLLQLLEKEAWGEGGLELAAPRLGVWAFLASRDLFSQDTKTHTFRPLLAPPPWSCGPLSGEEGTVSVIVAMGVPWACKNSCLWWLAVLCLLSPGHSMPHCPGDWLGWHCLPPCLSPCAERGGTGAGHTLAWASCLSLPSARWEGLPLFLSAAETGGGLLLRPPSRPGCACVLCRSDSFPWEDSLLCRGQGRSRVDEDEMGLD